MKKTLIILFLLMCFSEAYSQSMYLKRLHVVDSIYVPTRINAGAYYLNGVPFSAGGGDVYLGNRQTFTSRNVFSDTLKADGLSLIDDARITSQLNVTGDVISDLQFIKGSRVRIGTADSYRIDFKTADTNRFYIDSLGYAGFNKSLAVGTYLLATDSVGTKRLRGNELYFNAASAQIYWAEYGSSILEGVSNLNYTSNSHNFYTLHTTDIAQLDSATGFNLNYGNYYRNGVLLLDTSKYARTESSISEFFNSVVTFVSAVYFSAAATFNSTLTVVGDFIPTWTKTSTTVAPYQFEKTKIVAGKLPATTATAFTTPHGITDWHSIKSFTVAVHDDSSNVVILPNIYSDQTSSLGKIYNIAFIDSLNCNARVPATGLNIINDSIFFRIVYTDFNR